MKIAMMTNNYKPFVGGVPISVERLAEGLRRQGHEVVVFAPTYQERLQGESNVVRYHSLLKSVAGGAAIPNPMDPGIEKQFRKGNFDIIHVHHPVGIGNTAAYLSKKYHVPLVFTYHTRYEQYLHYIKPILWMENGAGKEGTYHRMQKEAMEVIKERLVPGYLKHFFSRCDHIFAPTEGMEAYLTRICDVEENRVSVLPTGLKEESFQGSSWESLQGEGQKAELLRKKYDACDCPLFITVSRLAQEKNIPFLLQALAYYKLLYRKKFRMLFLGDGPKRAEYEKMTAALHLEKEVIFTGKMDNARLPDYYRAADLFLFASKTETQGIVILEAMAAETPVIAVRATGVSDLVKDGENGFCVKEEVADFAGAMNEVLNRTGLFMQLKSGAVQTANAFREEQIAQTAAGIYNIVLCQNREKHRENQEKHRKSSLLYEGNVLY